MLKRFTTHTLMALAEASLVALLVVGLIAGTAFAARGGGGKPSAVPNGSCSVAPDPVAIGSDWTMTGWNLGSNRIFNVLVIDSMGTTAFNLGSDANGRLSHTWHSYWPGTSTVKFNVISGRKISTAAICTFAVY